MKRKLSVALLKSKDLNQSFEGRYFDTIDGKKCFCALGACAFSIDPKGTIAPGFNNNHIEGLLSKNFFNFPLTKKNIQDIESYFVFGSYDAYKSFILTDLVAQAAKKLAYIEGSMSLFDLVTVLNDIYHFSFERIAKLVDYVEKTYGNLPTYVNLPAYKQEMEQ